ncbi:hypothetical protein [Vagococcus carniphilus]|uniref:hypothetical protein n=1 Tax=Vagococcus carniphilus TaxID=218144 RepID=UPI003B5AB78F
MKMLGEVFTFLGGASFIILLIKIYLDYKKKDVLQKKQYELEKELSNIKTKQDSVLFMTNKQYEKEFEIFLDLLEMLGGYVLKFYSLQANFKKWPNGDEYELIAIDIERVRNIRNRIVVFIVKYSIFLPGNVEDDLSDIIDVIDEFNTIVEVSMSENTKPMPSEEWCQYNNKLSDKVHKKSDSVKLCIKDYLNSLKVISN